MTLVGFRAQNHRQQVGRRGAVDKVDDRRTPRSLFGPLNEEFGFTLDVAASRANALAEAFFDRESDGLTQPWSGVVWCNPPYSDIRPWVEKARAEIDSRVRGCGSFSCVENDHLFWPRPAAPTTIVMLLPANRTEQGWWQDVIEPGRRAGEIETRFLRGRLRFDTPDHDYTKQPKGNRPPFGVVLVIWRRS